MWCRKVKVSDRPETTILKVLLFIVFFCVWESFGFFVKPSEATDAAKIAGYADIKVSGKAALFMAFRGCSGEDDARFTVQATNVRGEKVEFYVCSSLFFKGSTIRTR